MTRIDPRTHPVGGTAAREIGLAVARALREALPELRDDPAFTVGADPRGTYTGVTAHVPPASVEAATAAAERIENELEADGIPTLINVRCGA